MARRQALARSVLPSSDELVDRLLRGVWDIDDLAERSRRPVEEIERLADRCVVNYVKRTFDELAAGYEDTIFREKDYSAYHHLPALVLERLPPGTHRVLDLGCGTGLSSQEFLRRGYEVVGIDASRRMIEKARSRAFEALHCRNLEKRWPVAASSFDVVIAVGIMEYIMHPDKLLRRAYAAMNPDGLLAITIPRRQRFAPIRSHTKRDACDFFREAKLRVLRCERFPGWGYDATRTVDYYGFLLAKRAAKKLTSGRR